MSKGDASQPPALLFDDGCVDLDGIVIYDEVKAIEQGARGSAAFRTHVLRSLGAKLDRLQEQILILGQHLRACERYRSEEDDEEEFTTALNELVSLLNKLFPIFRKRDGALASSHSASQPLQPVSWDMYVQNDIGTDPRSFPPLPLRVGSIKRHDLIEGTGGTVVGLGEGTKLADDDYARSTTSEWDRLGEVAEVLDSILDSFDKHVEGAPSIERTIADTQEMLIDISRVIHEKQTAETAMQRVETLEEDAIGQELQRLLDPLRVLVQGCKFHAVEPSIIPSRVLPLLRGCDFEDVRVNDVMFSYQGLRFVRIVGLPASPGDEGESDEELMDNVRGRHFDPSLGLLAASQNIHSDAVFQQRLQFSPVAANDTTDLAKDTQALYWLTQALFNKSCDPKHDLVCPSTLITAFSQEMPLLFHVTHDYDVDLLSFLDDRSRAPFVTDEAIAKFAVTALLTTLDDASGKGVCVSSGACPDGGIFAVHNIALLRNPFDPLTHANHSAEEADIVLGWRNPLFCCPWLLDIQLPQTVVRRLQRLAPACVLAKWLGNTQIVEDELRQMMEQEGVPLTFPLGSLGMRPGIMVRMHRTLRKIAALLATVVNNNGSITIGQLYETLYPLHSRVTNHVRSAHPSSVRKAFALLSGMKIVGDDILPAEMDVDGMKRKIVITNTIEQVIPYADHRPKSIIVVEGTSSSSGAPLPVKSRYKLSQALYDLLHSLLLDRTDHPLSDYNDERCLELTLHISSYFPELGLYDFPSYWRDPNQLFRLLSSSVGSNVVSPRILWLFREFINARIAKTTIMHTVIRNSRDDAILQQQIEFMVREIGADVDVTDGGKYTPVDICANDKPDVFIQLMSLGACGGVRSGMHQRLYHTLLKDDPEYNTVRMQAMRCLASRNKELGWLVNLSSVFPSNPGPSAVDVQLETFNQSRIEGHHFKKLFRDGVFRESATMTGRRPMAKLYIDHSDNNNWLAFKKNPEFPGIELIAGFLSRSIFGSWISPSVELARFETLPILISQGVSGFTLKQVMEIEVAKQCLAGLDFYHTSAAIINAMILMPEDGKPADYVIEHYELGKYRPVCVDNERAFCPNHVQPGEGHVGYSNTLTSKGARSIASRLKPKSALFCLDQMARPVDAAVRDRLCSLDMLTIVRKWVAKAQQHNLYHRSLFERNNTATYLEDSDEPACIGIPMHKQLPIQVFDKLRRIQRFLSLNHGATHMDLLQLVEPKVAARYAPAFEKHMTLQERFAATDGDLYTKTIAGALRSPLAMAEMLKVYGVNELSAMSLLVLKGLDMCPKKALTQFMWVSDRIPHDVDLKRQIMDLSAKPTLFTDLAADSERERWLDSVDFDTVEKVSQLQVIKSLEHHSLQSLALRNAHFLSDALFAKLSIKFIFSINISGCTGITSKTLSSLATGAQNMRELCVRRCLFKSCGNKHKFPNLRKIDFSDCPVLISLGFSAPLLTHCIADRCALLENVDIKTPSLVHLSLNGSDSVAVCITQSAEDVTIQDSASSNYNTLASSSGSGSSTLTSTFSGFTTLQSGTSTFFKKTTKLFRGSSAPQSPTATLASGDGEATLSAEAEETMKRVSENIAFWSKTVIGNKTFSSLSGSAETAAIKHAKEGIPENIRGEVWFRITGGHVLYSNDPKLYEKASIARFGSSPPSQDLSDGFFGVQVDFQHFHLTYEERIGVVKVLYCLVQEYPALDYCPWLPSFVACCRKCMSETWAYYSASALLNKSRDLLRTPADSWQMLLVVDMLAHRLLPGAVTSLFEDTEYTESQGLAKHPLQGAIVSWLIDGLPAPTLMVLFDNFLLKGKKIIYRFGLALLRAWFQDKVQKVADAEENGETYQGVDTLPEDFAREAEDPYLLSQSAFSFDFRTKELHALEKQAEARLAGIDLTSSLGGGIKQIPVGPELGEGVSLHVSVQPQQIVWSKSASVDIDTSSFNMPQLGQVPATRTPNMVSLKAPKRPSSTTPPPPTTSRAHGSHRTASTSSTTSTSATATSSRHASNSTSTGTHSVTPPMSSASPFVRSMRQSSRSNILRRRHASAKHNQRMRRRANELLKSCYSDFYKGQNNQFAVDQEMTKAYIPRSALQFDEVSSVGKGNFGEVSLATITKDLFVDMPPKVKRLLKHKEHIRVAVKSVRSDASEDQQAALMIEAKLMWCLRHKHLVTMLGSCQYQTPYLLVLEFMAGGNVRDYLRKEKEVLSQDKVRLVGEQIASAMKYLQEEAHIIHRDLAARNVLVQKNLSLVKLADFGLSKSIGGEEKTYKRDMSELVPWRTEAPESLRSGVYSDRTDVWAFGVFLWEVSTYAYQPYKKMNMGQVSKMINQGYRLPPTDLSSGVLYTIMKQCWHQLAQRRPAFAHLLSMLKDARVDATPVRKSELQVPRTLQPPQSVAATAKEAKRENRKTMSHIGLKPSGRGDGTQANGNDNGPRRGPQLRARAVTTSSGSQQVKRRGGFLDEGAVVKELAEGASTGRERSSTSANLRPRVDSRARSGSTAKLKPKRAPPMPLVPPRTSISNKAANLSGTGEDHTRHQQQQQQQQFTSSASLTSGNGEGGSHAKMGTLKKIAESLSEETSVDDGRVYLVPGTVTQATAQEDAARAVESSSDEVFGFEAVEDININADNVGSEANPIPLPPRRTVATESPSNQGVASAHQGPPKPPRTMHSHQGIREKESSQAPLTSAETAEIQPPIPPRPRHRTGTATAADAVQKRRKEPAMYDRGDGEDHEAETGEADDVDYSHLAPPVIPPRPRLHLERGRRGSLTLAKRQFIGE